jgi:hypothetical protein
MLFIFIFKNLIIILGKLQFGFSFPETLVFGIYLIQDVISILVDLSEASNLILELPNL